LILEMAKEKKNNQKGKKQGIDKNELARKETKIPNKVVGNTNSSQKCPAHPLDNPKGKGQEDRDIVEPDCKPQSPALPKEPKICESCGKAPATIKYCNSALEWTHGFVQNLCKDCYREKLLTIIETCKATLNELDK